MSMKRRLEDECPSGYVKIAVEHGPVMPSRIFVSFPMKRWWISSSSCGKVYQSVHPRKNHHFPMVFQCFSHFSYSFPMVFLRFPMVSLPQVGQRSALQSLGQRHGQGRWHRDRGGPQEIFGISRVVEVDNYSGKSPFIVDYSDCFLWNLVDCSGIILSFIVEHHHWCCVFSTWFLWWFIVFIIDQ